MSPKGSFVVAHWLSYETGDRYRVLQYLWDLRSVKPQTPVKPLNPIQDFLVDDSEQGPDFAFSPNGRLLAVASAQAVSVLALARLDVVEELPAVNQTLLTEIHTGFDKRVSWSKDGTLLAFLTDTELAVWDAQTHAVTSYPFGATYHYGDVETTELGWLAVLADPRSFVLCTWRLESCDWYELNAPSIIIPSPDGQSIIMQSGQPEIVANLWHRQSDGRYQLDAEVLPFCPFSFSPDSRYLYGDISCNKRTHFGIYDVQTLTLYFRIPIPNDDVYVQWFDENLIRWLPDKQHIVFFRPGDDLTLYLYEIGEDKPVDTLTLTAIPGLEHLKDWVIAGPSSGIAGLAIDGQRLLLNFVQAVLVVPIEYE